MAESPSHQFGQIIGTVLEDAIRPLLQRFADQHGLYLDMKGPRPCRKGKKCAWIDLNGNSHDLDYVLERGGAPDKIGMPAAFIETAWRRYTKHSRNKAQEIQGAIEPLAETYRNVAPFKGAVLAGVFTEGSLAQLQSLGFAVVYIPYESIISVFKPFRIDARFDETTADEEFRKKVDSYRRLSKPQRTRLISNLVRGHADDINVFLKELSSAVLRQIERIVICALHGRVHEVTTVADAIEFIEAYSDVGSHALPVQKYEIQVRYNNGNVIDGRFVDKESAVAFLRTYEPVVAKIADA